MKNLEYRTVASIELRDAPKDSGFLAVLTGYAAKFNSDSVRFAGWQSGFITAAGRKKPAFTTFQRLPH